MNWWSRLARRRELECDMDAELRDHLDRLIADYANSGMSVVDAERAARLDFGSVVNVQEQCRDSRGTGWIDSVLRDLRLAWRDHRTNPGYTVVVVLTMALGVGASASIFSLVNAILLKPLAYQDAERIISFSNFWPASGGRGPVSIADFLDWQSQSNAFTAMAYYADYDTAIKSGVLAEYAHVARVSPQFFDVFAVEPVAGRLFAAEEEKSGSSGGAVLSYTYWQTRFGGSLDVIGQSIQIYGTTVPVVGILPKEFAFPERTDIWCPAATLLKEVVERGAPSYLALARLKPDVPLKSAKLQMDKIAARLAIAYPESNLGKGIYLAPMREALVGKARATLYPLLSATALMVIIAILNLCNLLVVQSAVRSREVAVRLALGASRARIDRQLITESALLALMGTTGGIVLAAYGSWALARIWPGNEALTAHVGFDSRVLVFTLAVSGLIALLFGLGPLAQARRVDVSTNLRNAASNLVISTSANKVRRRFVTAQIGLSVILLVVSGLFIKSFVVLSNVPLGYVSRNVALMDTSASASDLLSARQASHMYKNLLSRLGGLPGVQDVGAIRRLPSDAGSYGPYWVNEPPRTTDEKLGAPQAVYSIVSPHAFGALEIPLVRGRDFSANDGFGAPLVAVISQTLAQEAFKGQNPVGRTIVCSFDSLNPMTVIGVVGDIKQYGRAIRTSPEIFMAYEQHPVSATAMHILARTAGGERAMSQIMRKMVREVPPDVPVRATTLEAVVSQEVAVPRFRTLLVSGFALVALLLTATGVYGATSYAVKQRSAEIGLRLALGAGPSEIFRLVLCEGLSLVGLGMSFGVIGAIGLSQLVAKGLFQVRPMDLTTYFFVAGLLSVVGAAASYFPARRAVLLDPALVLRHL